MANRVQQWMQKLVAGKTRAEIMAHAVKKEDAVDLTDVSEPTAKTDSSEDYYTSFEKLGRSYKGRTYTMEREQMLANPRGYVHRSKIIKERAFFIERAQDRNIVHYYSPWASAIRKKIPEHLCGERPVFAKPGQDDKKDGQLEEIPAIVEFWNDARMDEIWQKAVSKSYIHGTCIYYNLHLTDAQRKWYSAPPAYVVANDEFRPCEWDLGHPVRWEVTPTNKELEPYFPDTTNSVFFDYSNSDDFDGVPLCIASWDSIIDLVFIQDAVNSFDQRFGNGFMVLVVPNGTIDEDMETYETTLKNLRTNRGLVVRGDVEEPVQVDWMGMGGTQVDFIGHISKIEDLIALDLGFPKRWLLGDQEGAMESSGKDMLQINIKLKALFKPWVVWMKRVFMHHGLIKQFGDVEILPSYKMQMSEQETAELDVMKTDNIAAKTWLTVDEQRELDGYDPATEEQKAELTPPEEPMDDDTPPKSTIDGNKSDAYDLIEALFDNNDISINRLAQATGVSPTTISKIRSNVQLANQPMFKADELTIKTDSVALGDDIYVIEDVPLVLPQERQYGDRLCVRPREAIEQAFNDPKTPKQFRIGVSKDDLHTSRVPLEVLSEMTVGTTKFKRIDEKGNIRGDITYDLKAADNILGENNWIRDMTLKNENPNTSIALYTKDRPENGKYIESNLDFRSFVFTRKPRNTEAGK